MTDLANQRWSSRLTFILASIGAAVGLGNIWKFPYTLGNSGGSAFVLVYLIAILLVAMPVMIAEMVIGRSARKSAPTAIRELAVNNGRSEYWGFLGWMGLGALVLVLSFYSVIAGWTAAYLFKSASGALSGLSPGEVGAGFDHFLHQPKMMIVWHAIFTGSTVLIVSRGVNAGLEKVVRFLMPALFIALFILVINSAIVGDFAAAIEYLFKPDISKITGPVILAAVGQAFFSLNVGVGSVLTYSAYLPKDVNLFRSAIAISVGDTLVALLAGLAIFPIVFAHNLDPADGPGLVFVTLSSAFASIPGGAVFGTLFFVMLLFAALTTSISMLETLTARAVELRGISRRTAAATIGFCTFLFGLITVLSFSSWENFFPLSGFELFAEKTPFDLIDYFVSNLLMPVGGVLYAVFAGWWLSREQLVSQIGVGDGLVFKLWLLAVRIIAPLAIATVFLVNLT
jgi:NSS family neurotransmitter:Na+ symporter